MVQGSISWILPHLIDLAIDPTPLLTWCAARPIQKLGRYFQMLVSDWLHHVHDIRDIKQSLQGQNHNQTVGEFDFLFRDQRAQRRYHFEVAIKFCLRHGNGQSLADYWGPSQRCIGLSARPFG